MTNSKVDRLIVQYLTRLSNAAQVLPADRRDELLAEIQEHIDASGAGETGSGEAAVRTMLDRLGEPADIVAAALDDGSSTKPAYPKARHGSQHGLTIEVAAVLMLTVGSLIPVIGWLVGVVLLWSSSVWRWPEKLLGTLVFPGGPALGLYAAAFLLSFGQSGAIGMALILLVALGPLIVGFVLLSRSRSRTALESH